MQVLVALSVVYRHLSKCVCAIHIEYYYILLVHAQSLCDSSFRGIVNILWAKFRILTKKKILSLEHNLKV